MTEQIISIIAAIVVFAAVLILGFKTKLLREKDLPGSPYSLSKFQLWLWTLILGPAFILHWGYHDDTHINNTFLILIGISASVTLTSGMMTQANIARNNANIVKGLTATPLKANGSSAGFWIDLLKGDSDSLSVERLQHLVEETEPDRDPDDARRGKDRPEVHVELGQDHDRRHDQHHRRRDRAQHRADRAGALRAPGGNGRRRGRRAASRK